MRYRLRTLLILLVVGPPLLAPVIAAVRRAIEAWRDRPLGTYKWKPAGPGARNVYTPLHSQVRDVLIDNVEPNP